MLKYVFAAIFALLFISSFFKLRSNKSPSISMLVGYVFYIFFILPMVNYLSLADKVDASNLYFLLLGLLDVCIGLYLSSVYMKNGDSICRNVALLEFASVFNHLYGRIYYYPGWDNNICHYLSISITISIITLMIWPAINGLFSNICKLFNRAFNLGFNYYSSKEFRIAYAVKNQKG